MPSGKSAPTQSQVLMIEPDLGRLRDGIACADVHVVGGAEEILAAKRQGTRKDNGGMGGRPAAVEFPQHVHGGEEAMTEIAPEP